MISIIIPTYNRAYIIRRTLNSLVAQEYKEWECLVVDDASTDETVRVVEDYVVRDNRFRFCKNRRKKGAQGARNTGIMEARGEWVVLFDSDNEMKPNFLTHVAKYSSNKECDVITCWSDVISSDNGNVIGEFKWYCDGLIHERLMTGASYVDNSSAVIRKKCLEEIGCLDEECPAFQEWDTHLRLSRKARYYTIKEYLVRYYAGAADSISSDGKKDVKGYIFILGKFKEEWLRKRPFHFLKYSAILQMKLEKLQDEEKLQYTNQYKKVVGIYRPLVWLLSKLLTLKHK